MTIIEIYHLCWWNYNIWIIIIIIIILLLIVVVFFNFLNFFNIYHFVSAVLYYLFPILAYSFVKTLTILNQFYSSYSFCYFVWFFVISPKSEHFDSFVLQFFLYECVCLSRRPEKEIVVKNSYLSGLNFENWSEKKCKFDCMEWIFLIKSPIRDFRR